jgi:ribosome recycling factor
MAAGTFDLNDIKRRMGAGVDVLKKDLSGLRTGRASLNLLEPITVEAYGGRSHLKEVAGISVPEPRMLQVSVYDRGLVVAVEKAIREANLGLNPQTEGSTIRIKIPELTQDRRKELVKAAHKYAEDQRVAVRHVRRDGMELLKKLEKDGKIPLDQAKRDEALVQKATDESIGEIDKALASKEKEIMTV